MTQNGDWIRFDLDVRSFGELVDRAAGLLMVAAPPGGPKPGSKRSPKQHQRELLLFEAVMLSCKTYTDQKITVKVL